MLRILIAEDEEPIANLIRMLKEAGALEVHVRISSPPFLHPCYFGTDVPSNDYLEGMAGGLPICKACFDGKYPMEIPDENNLQNDFEIHKI